MNKIAKKPDPDIRTDTLVRFYLELADEPGRKRDKLHRAVLKMIEQGFWNPGDRLPTDSEFSQLLPLSVATVQAALAMLADQQVIVRKQKQGSFIMSEEHLSRDMVFFCFQHPDQDSDASVEFTSFSIFETEAPCPGEAFFGKDRPMLCISRDAEIAESFTVTSDVYLADPRIRILLDLDPDTLRTLGLRTLLQTRFGLPSVRLNGTSEPPRCPPTNVNGFGSRKIRLARSPKPRCLPSTMKN